MIALGLDVLLKLVHGEDRCIDMLLYSFMQEGDHVLVRPQRQKLNAQDKFLRKFMYREALSSALASSDPTVIMLSF